MLESELSEFASTLTMDTIEGVFLRFPQDGKVRATVYRKVASFLQEIAADLLAEYEEAETSPRFGF